MDQAGNVYTGSSNNHIVTDLPYCYKHRFIYPRVVILQEEFLQNTKASFRTEETTSLASSIKQTIEFHQMSTSLQRDISKFIFFSLLKNPILRL